MRVTWSLRDARARRDEESVQRAFDDASARWEHTAGRLGELIDTAHTLGIDDAPLLPPGCPVALKRVRKLSMSSFVSIGTPKCTGCRTLRNSDVGRFQGSSY